MNNKKREVTECRCRKRLQINYFANEEKKESRVLRIQQAACTQTKSLETTR